MLFASPWLTPSVTSPGGWIADGVCYPPWLTPSLGGPGGWRQCLLPSMADPKFRKSRWLDCR